MANFVPTLSSAGWISTVEEKADYALSCFLTSEFSQSVLFEGGIRSLQYLVRTYGGNRSLLQNECSESLNALMQNYFQDIDTRVEVFEQDSDRPGELKIQFRCIVRQNGKEIAVGKRVQFVNGRLEKIVAINNG